jgi:hypothetical protein
MTGNEDPAPERYPVLSAQAIGWASAVLLAVGVAVAVWLLVAYGDGGDAARNQLEAVKTAGTVVVGTGGGAALLLAARRQRSTEMALRDAAKAYALQERVAAATEADAVARRITELYTKAVEQLGSSAAPVRLGGLYALERLAQDNEDQRGTIVNVLCAYLRMSDPPNGDDDDQVTVEQASQEPQVRLTAQRILHRHRRRARAALYWDEVAIDLVSADLTDARLAGIDLAGADLTGTCLTGAVLAGADLTGTDLTDARMAGANIEGAVWDDGTRWPAELASDLRTASEPAGPGLLRVK